MTGMHALHVLSGIVLIFIMWNLARKKHFTPERHWGIEAAAIYWHYVDVVWIFFYPAIYLIGVVGAPLVTVRVACTCDVTAVIAVTRHGHTSRNT